MDEGHREAEDIIGKVEVEIEKSYSEALKELRERQRKFMDDYESELRKKKGQVKSGEITQDDLDSWLRYEQLRSDWFKGMVDELSRGITDADKAAMRIVNGYTPDAYASNANFGAYQVESAGKVDTSFALYDRDTVDKLIAERPDLLPQASVDDEKDLRWNRQHVTSAITQSVLQGESIDQAAKRLKAVVGMGNRSAVRAARTAITGAENSGRVDSYKRARALGIGVKKEWLATLDSRTRDSHRKLDGERVEVDGTFSNGLRYPGDPNGAASEVYNCRCTLVAAVEEVDQSDARRDSRLGDMTYAEWKEGHNG